MGTLEKYKKLAEMLSAIEEETGKEKPEMLLLLAVLMNIDKRLERLATLSDCVDKTPGYGARMCVTGTIVNYEG